MNTTSREFLRPIIAQIAHSFSSQPCSSSRIATATAAQLHFGSALPHLPSSSLINSTLFMQHRRAAALLLSPASSLSSAAKTLLCLNGCSSRSLATSSSSTSSSPHNTTINSLSASSYVFKATQEITSSMLRVHGVSGARKCRQRLWESPLTINLDPTASCMTFTIPPELSAGYILNQLPSHAAFDWSATKANEVAAQLSVPIPASQWSAAKDSVQASANYSGLPINFVMGGSSPERIIPAEGASPSPPPLGDFVSVALTPTLTAQIPQEPMAALNSDPERIEAVLNQAGSSLRVGAPIFSLPQFLPHRSFRNVVNFITSFILNYRFYLVFMARSTFQAVRPLLAFCVFGEAMKLALAMMSSGVFIFAFSFVLAFEVLYFFLQCYISYVFLGMFFTAAF